MSRKILFCEVSLARVWEKCHMTGLTFKTGFYFFKCLYYTSDAFTVLILHYLETSVMTSGIYESLTFRVVVNG